MLLGKQLKTEGMDQAVMTADSVIPIWSTRAYDFLVNYAKYNYKFMSEDVRTASESEIPTPPSNRAWGAVIVKAKKNGIIKHFGYGQVKNPIAHMANASVWISQIF